MSALPLDLKPEDGERAVLSALCVRDGERWTVVGGSLLTVPEEAAELSWDAWAKIQPSISGRLSGLSEFDPGRELDDEPFPGVRVVRRFIAMEDWESAVDKLLAQESPDGWDLVIESSEWSPVVQIPTSHSSPAGTVVAGVQRPVRGAVGNLRHREMPTTDVTWTRVSDEAHLGNWPEATVAVGWPAGSELDPPGAFVVGRMEADAWIVGMRLEKGDESDLNVYLKWDPTRIDPLSCSLLITSADNGLPVLRRQIQLSDLPSDQGAPTGAHRNSWRDHLLTARVPRGPRKTERGVALFGPDGRLIDEWPVANRVETVSISISVVGGGDPTNVVVGDRQSPPSASEQTAAALAAVELEVQARAAAALRRVSTAGELESYLRWRFSCRGGELLLLDPYLFSGDIGTEVAFLAGLDRSIRALRVGQVSPVAAAALAATPNIEVRALPAGAKLHDRVWIVGTTGLLVGTSVGGFLPKSGGKYGKTTTVAELPHADVEAWRKQFGDWWT